jgi:uncharacterized membrane protein
MEPAVRVALCWLLFAGTHIGLATRRIRAALVSALGIWGFTRLFSVVAALTFALLIHTYAAVRFDGLAGPALGHVAAVRWIAIGAITTGVALITASIWVFPATTMPLINEHVAAPRGLERITRHPFFIGVALLGLSHALLATRLVGSVAFGGLALFAIVGALHQDAKLSAHLGERYTGYLATTSLVPFAAVLSGRQRIVWNELPATAMAVGIAVAFLLRSVHSSILDRGGAWVILGVVGGAFVALIQTRIHRRPQSAPVAASDHRRAA